MSAEAHDTGQLVSVDRDAVLAAIRDTPGALERTALPDEVTDSGRIKLATLARLGPSLFPDRPKPVRVGCLHWRWQVTDGTAGPVLAQGWAPTERWACRRSLMAALAEFNRRQTERAETDR